VTSLIKTLAIGAFDGVHLGHQYLLDGCDIALSFNPIPKSFFNSQQKILTTISEKKRLFAGFVFEDFTADLSKKAPLEFLESIVMKYDDVCSIKVGWDFRFGRDRQGGVEELQFFCDSHDIALQTASAFKIDGTPVKSSYIRSCLDRGALSEANKLLGYHYLISGEVVKGKSLGQKMGFPTLNLKIESNKCLPINGVYLGRVFLDVSYHCLVSIGSNPTVNSGKNISVEVHILDYSGKMIYGELVTVELEAFVSEQIKFDSQVQLKEHISLLVNKVKCNYLKA
jgi:riboflavin kinase / FMN adenylyltransferase